MDRKVTWRRIETGRYVNDETGIELRSNGHRWGIYRPVRGKKGTSPIEQVTSGLTFNEARNVAAVTAIPMQRTRIAAAYADAAKSYVSRISTDLQDNAGDAGWAAATQFIEAANECLRNGAYDRARAFIREAQGFADRADRADALPLGDLSQWGDLADLTRAAVAAGTESADVAAERLIADLGVTRAGAEAILRLPIGEPLSALAQV